MKYVFLTLLILFSSFCYSQTQYLKVNRDEVKRKVLDSSLNTFYPKLLDRFLADDTTLSIEDYRLLYYGFVFQKAYVAYPNLQQPRIRKELEDKNYSTCLQICDSILTQIPISLIGNYYKGLAMYNANNNDPSYSNFRNRFKNILNAIVSSGDGLTCDTAFKTIFVSDEYQVIYKYFQIETFLSQALELPCDRMNIKPSKYFSSEKMYFDTSETFEYMKKIMKKD